MPNLRPVFNRLPSKGFQDNPVADYLTDFYDSKLVEVGTSLEQLYLKLKPATAPDSYLDYIAALIGAVHPYYDTSWRPAIKRQFISKVNYLFSNKGTKNALDTAIKIHGFEYSFYSGTDLVFNFTLPATFASTSGAVFIQLPLKYSRSGYEFSETSRAIRNYTSVHTQILPCYNKFYLDFSQIGDPLF